MTETIQWKIKDSKPVQRMDVCCTALQGTEEMSLARLHAVSQFDSGPGVLEGAESHDAWQASPGRWLMPPDRLRLQGCVQHLRVCQYLCISE